MTLLALVEVSTAEGLRRAQANLDDLATSLADAASDLRAAGCSWSELAGALGVVVNSAKERYGCAPRPFEVERFRRRLASWETTRARVSSVGRFVVAELADALDERPEWRIVRHCATPVEASQLARYLGESDHGRYVARAKNLDAAEVAPWAYGHGEVEA